MASWEKAQFKHGNYICDCCCNCQVFPEVGWYEGECPHSLQKKPNNWHTWSMVRSVTLQEILDSQWWDGPSGKQCFWVMTASSDFSPPPSIPEIDILCSKSQCSQNISWLSLHSFELRLSLWSWPGSNMATVFLGMITAALFMIMFLDATVDRSYHM